MVSPIRDAAGAIVGAAKIARDITERRRAELAAQRLAAIVESSDDAIVAKDLDGIITNWNQGAERLFGYTAEEVIGKPITILIPPERQAEEPEILARIRRGGRVSHYETVRRRKDGSVFDVSLTVSPIRNAHGKIVGASKIARDITERRRAQEHQVLLLREMDHRIKNLFAVAAGVVALSARSATTPAAMSSAVRERLGALARAHALTLPRIGDDGRRSEEPATVHSLLDAIFSPYSLQTDDGETRVRIEGPDVPVFGSALTSLALLFNEFATNAAKYGALSHPEGRIAIECADDADLFIVTWSERGGPAVGGEMKEGFGTLLARATVKGQLGGEISRDWNPAGLTIRLSLAKDRLGIP
jgi:PAS domain S-box-containing protein